MGRTLYKYYDLIDDMGELYRTPLYSEQELEQHLERNPDHKFSEHKISDLAINLHSGNPMSNLKATGQLREKLEGLTKFYRGNTIDNF